MVEDAERDSLLKQVRDDADVEGGEEDDGVEDDGGTNFV